MSKDADKTIKDFAPIPVRAALDADLGAAPLRVLILLTAHVDKNGTCFPSQGTLGKQLGISRQAVGQHIQKLKDRGYIRAERQNRQNGSETSCRYYIVYANPLQDDLSSLQADLSEESLPFTPLQAPDLSPPASTGTCTHNIPIEQTNNNALFETQGKKPSRKKTGRIYTDDFNEFWKSFPHGLNPDKAKAFDQWEAITGEGIIPGDLLRALEIHAAQVNADKTEPKYRKRAHTWLEGRVWESLLETPIIVNGIGGVNWTPF